jgi:predicted O-linked N-acetylglucosamine transferase (SPINDLY family)
MLSLLKEALSHQNAGRLAEADACYRTLRELAPRHPDVLHGLGLLRHQRGHHAEAIEYIAEALSLYEGAEAPLAPRAAAHNNLGAAWFALNEPGRAAQSFSAAIRLDPRYTAAYCNLGNAQCGQLDFTAAAASYREALRLDPGNAAALAGLSEAALALGQHGLAEQYCRQAIALHPRNVSARLWLVKVYLELGRVEQALAYCEEAAILAEAEDAPTQDAADDAVYAADALALILNYLPQHSPEVAYRVHRRYGERFEDPLRSGWPVHTNARERGKRLKIGYMSPDFRGHSVAFFIAPVLAQHDKTQVEVYCYYNNTIQSPMTARLRSLADHWIPCRSLTDEQLAQRIMDDGIDILVDLAGHTRGNRLLVFARKPAPVQVSYLGYPATTGLTAMDYRLVTAETDPEGAEQWHSERLYRLPRSLWCYRPPATAGEVQGETPARGAGSITFGSMNNIAKVSEAAIATWSEILKRVRGARLVMTGLADGARQRMREQFESRGIGEARLQLHGRLGTEEFHRVLGTIDLALDTFPYAGTTTTCEALWQGVPVLTLKGETSVSRSGHALLQMLGLDELIAPNEAEYVQKAIELANDLDRLDALRRGMRSRFDASPLRDEAGFTRELEAAYRVMWADWCSRAER